MIQNYAEHKSHLLRVMPCEVKHLYIHQAGPLAD